MSGTFVHIESVEKRHDGEYRVYYATEFGGRLCLSVAATDELDAYTKATTFIKRKINMERHLIWAGSLVLCLLITVAGYGCTRPSNMVQCRQDGGTYVYRGALNEVPTVEACLERRGQ